MTWNKIRSDRWGLLGLFIVLVFLALAIGAWLGWLGQDWARADGGRWEPPGAGHWFGTNALGQDIFQRMVVGSRTAFEIGLIVALATTILGAAFGALSGWRATTWVDDVVVWIMGVLDSVPFYLFVAALAYAMQAARKADRDNNILVNLSGRGDKDLDMVLPILIKEQAP